MAEVSYDSLLAAVESKYAENKSVEQIKELMDEVEELKILRGQKIVEHQGALEEIAAVSDRLRRKSNELDACLYAWREQRVKGC